MLDTQGIFLQPAWVGSLRALRRDHFPRSPRKRTLSARRRYTEMFVKAAARGIPMARRKRVFGCHKQRLALSAAVVCIPCLGLQTFMKSKWKHPSASLQTHSYWAPLRGARLPFSLAMAAAIAFCHRNSISAPIFTHSRSSAWNASSPFPLSAR
jgi:hypothetical protein